ncbi:patatin-like phospholipase family protein [Olsenella sp. Marseille-QA0557]|uniref:patatin-like phospholipase family protein n=1 Tax=Olsenella sp. Marseille-QA0557 TaxID=3378782 RepID=UPI003D0C6DEB
MSKIVSDVALVIEGGGMRAAYSAGLLSVLLEQGIEFSYICGVSAGASCATNYMTHDIDRLKRCFVDIADDPQIGGTRSFLRGHGYFNSEYLYGRCCYPDGALPFNMDAFLASDVTLRVQAFERDTGRTVLFSREDMDTLDKLLTVIRASSSLPIVMNPTAVNGRVMYDGGLGTGAGLPTHIAEKDGFSRFFVVTTRQAGYRKTPPPGMKRRLMLQTFRDYPYVRDALLTRASRYNNALDHLAALEADGNALVVRPDVMKLKNTTLNRDELEVAYALGHSQGLRELPRWLAFLGITDS